MGGQTLNGANVINVLIATRSRDAIKGQILVIGLISETVLIVADGLGREIAPMEIVDQIWGIVQT